MPSGIGDPGNRELLLVAIIVASSFISMALFIMGVSPIVVVVPSLVAIAFGIYLLRWLASEPPMPQMPKLPPRPKGRSRRRNRKK